MRGNESQKGHWEPLLCYDEYSNGEVRFILDNDVSVPVVLNWLQGAGGSAVTLPLEFRQHRDFRGDRTVLAEAKRQSRMLITHDDGFMDYDEHPPETNPGVIVIPGGSGNVEEFLPDLAALLSHISLQPLLWQGTYNQLHPDGTISSYQYMEDEGEIGYERLRITDEGELEYWQSDEEASKT